MSRLFVLWCPVLLLLTSCLHLKPSSKEEVSGRTPTRADLPFIASQMGVEKWRRGNDVTGELQKETLWCSYALADRPKLDAWAKEQDLTIEDWGAETADRREAVVIGKQVKMKVGKQRALRIIGAPDGSAPGIFFVKSHPGRGKELEAVLTTLRLFHADWVVEAGEAYDSGGKELPEKKIRRLFLVRVSPAETTFWKQVLEKQPVVSAVQDMVEAPFLGIVDLLGGVKSQSTARRLLQLMRERGYYFLHEENYWSGKDSLQPGAQPSWGGQIWVPVGDEVKAVEEFKAIGCKAQLSAILDGVEVKDVVLSGQQGSSAEVGVPLTDEQIMKKLRECLVKHGPPNLEIVELGTLGLWGTTRANQPWALAGGGNDALWEKDDVKVIMSRSAAKKDSIVLHVMLRASSTGKGTTDTPPGDGSFKPAEQRGAHMLKLEQQFTRKLIDQFGTCLREEAL